MTKSNTPPVVFAVYPNANGFGFVYMENALKLIDYGSVRITPICNTKIIDRIHRSFEYFRPSIVLVQNPEGKTSRAGKRVRDLVEKIVAYATANNLPVVQYSRDQIRDVFEQFGATTKYQISQILLGGFKELASKSPKQRSLWTSEDRNMAIFDALSLALTWYYLND